MVAVGAAVPAALAADISKPLMRAELEVSFFKTSEIHEPPDAVTVNVNATALLSDFPAAE